LKINKQDPRHYWLLLLFAFNVLVGIVFRWVLGKRKGVIVLYGHKLNGNLLAIYEYLRSHPDSGFQVHYLTMDSAYAKVLSAKNVATLSSSNTRDVIQACRAEVVITDHGLHSLYLLLTLTNTCFIDVWHGIPFKGFDGIDYRPQHRYTATFVTSPSMEVVFTGKYGFQTSQVYVTGYGRTDRLYKGEYNQELIFKELNIENKPKKVVLYAPTWRHELGGHNPAECDLLDPELLFEMNEFARSEGFLLIVRSHLNELIESRDDLTNVSFVPLSQYPDTEAVLYVSDVLINDWSSIAFDFLVLRRPVVFIDRPPPFRKGFTYGPNYRFGPVVNNIASLKEMVRTACRDPGRFIKNYDNKMNEVSREVYDDSLDGHATQRYIENIAGIIANARH